MLDRLPPELLLDILDLALPPPSSTQSSSERKRALLACAQVSSRIRPAAQALLWRDVVLSRRPHLDRFKRAVQLVQGREDDLPSRVRTLRLLEEQAALAEAVLLLPELPYVEELHLRLRYSGDGDLERWSSHLSKLRSLQLVSTQVPSPFNPTLCFPSLVILRFDGFLLPPHIPILANLTAALFPSLCVLALNSITRLSSDPSLPDPGLLAQLDFLQVSWMGSGARGGWQTYPPLAEAVPRTLWVFHAADLSLGHVITRTRAKHIFIRSSAKRESEAFFETLAVLLRSLKSLPADSTALRSLHLRPLAEPLDGDEEGMERELEEQCRRCGVELVWLSREEDEMVDGVAAPFWRYAKRLREKEEKEVEEMRGRLSAV
ncbi:hypothetical protein JCM8097_006661 [Rhodosporidiobolus ruineniae]